MTPKPFEWNSPDGTLVKVWPLARVAVRYDSRWLVGTALKFNATRTQLAVRFDVGAPQRSIVIERASLEDGTAVVVPVCLYDRCDAYITKKKVDDLAQGNLNPLTYLYKTRRLLKPTPFAMQTLATLINLYVFDNKIPHLPPMKIEGGTSNANAYIKVIKETGAVQYLALHDTVRNSSTFVRLMCHELVHVENFTNSLAETVRTLAADGGHGQTFFAFRSVLAKFGIPLTATGSMTLSSAHAPGNVVFYLLTKHFATESDGTPYYIGEISRVGANEVDRELELLKRPHPNTTVARFVVSSDNALIAKQIRFGERPHQIDWGSAQRLLDSGEVLGSSENPLAEKLDISDMKFTDGSEPVKSDEPKPYAPPPPTRAAQRDIKDRLEHSALHRLNKELLAAYPNAEPLPVKFAVVNSALPFFRVTRNEKEQFLDSFDPEIRGLVWNVAQQLYTELSSSRRIEIADALTRECLLRMFRVSNGLADATAETSKQQTALLKRLYDVQANNLKQAFGIDPLTL